MEILTSDLYNDLSLDCGQISKITFAYRGSLRRPSHTWPVRNIRQWAGSRLDWGSEANTEASLTKWNKRFIWQTESFYIHFLIDPGEDTSFNKVQDPLTF